MRSLKTAAISSTTKTGAARVGLSRTRSKRGSQKSLMWGSILLAAIATASIVGPLIIGGDGTTQDFAVLLQAPSGSHPFGTDQFGRDVLLRTLLAGRLDLLIAFGLVAITFFLGTFLGIIAGWSGGWVDSVIERIVDVALAFPFLVLVIAIVAVRGPGLGSLFLAVSVVGWVFYARLTRGETRTVRRLDYIRAAEISGFSRRRILLRHLSPNVIVQPLVYASSDLVYALLLGTSVSFLGLGVQPPTPEWGAMVAEGRTFITSQWWLAFFPGVAIILTGVAFALIGDGVANATRGNRA